MGQSTISMAMFNSCLYVYQRVCQKWEYLLRHRMIYIFIYISQMFHQLEI